MNLNLRQRFGQVLQFSFEVRRPRRRASLCENLLNEPDVKRSAGPANCSLEPSITRYEMLVQAVQTFCTSGDDRKGLGIGQS